MYADGIIFDLDGTLWDSCRSVAESWQRTLRRFAPDARLSVDQIRKIMGMTAQQIADTLFSDFGEQAMSVCLCCLDEECAYIAKHGGSIYPGVAETLEKLSSEHSLYIVSNCLSGYIECFLDYSGFGKYFSDFLNPAITGLDKSGNIRQLIDSYGLKHPVYVGDTHMDAQSAREAGASFIHAAYGFGSSPDAENAITSFGELVGLIEPSFA